MRFYPSTLVLRPGGEPPLRLQRSREVMLRGWRRTEVETALRRAGIEPERALGDFGGEDADPEAFDAATSHDLVLVARHRQ